MYNWTLGEAGLLGQHTGSLPDQNVGLSGTVATVSKGWETNTIKITYPIVGVGARQFHTELMYSDSMLIGGEAVTSIEDAISKLTVLIAAFNFRESQIGLDGQSGYSRTGAFSGRPANNGYNWQEGVGIDYTQTDVDNGVFKVFSLNAAVHAAIDNPYWSTPTPLGVGGIGLFEGANLPNEVSTLVDYDYDFDANYPASSGTGFEGSTGRIKLNELRYGDQIRVRFDFNIIPQIANTTVEPALWYSNRNESDDITFTFPLTAQPIFYGAGTVGNTYLNRVEISAWITSSEDVNALTLPAIKSDNPVIIQPIGILITVVR